MPVHLNNDRLQVDLPLSRLKAIGADIQSGKSASPAECVDEYLAVLDGILHALPAERREVVRRDFQQALIGLLAWYHGIVRAELAPQEAMRIDVNTLLDRLKKTSPR